MFECVNESDEKGESENVARFGGDGDVHFLLRRFLACLFIAAALVGLPPGDDG